MADTISMTNSAGANTGIDTSRFRLRRPDFSHRNNAYLDAGWWPRSLELAAEVDDLLHQAAQAGFHTRRLLYSLDDGWINPPRRIRVAGTQVKLSGYHYQRQATVTLLDESGSNRLEVAVVPPDTDAAAAERALVIAGLDGDSTLASELLAQARTHPE